MASQLVTSLTLLFLVVASATEVTPVQKVIQMMQEMVEKGNAEIKAEQEEFAENKEFCETTSLNKTRTIQEATEKMGVLGAEIEKAASDADDLAIQIDGHQATVDSSTQELDAATKVREEEAADFAATLKDYTESLTAIEKATKVLSSQPKTRAQTEVAFVQLSALRTLKSFPEDAKSSLDAFLQQPMAAEGYEFQSGGVIGLLKKLKLQFVEERDALQRDELGKKTAYTTLKTGLDNEIAQATKERDTKSATKGERLEAKATAEGDLQETTAARDADQKYLNDLVASCRKKAEEYDQSQTMRKEEMEAVGKAIEIISGGAVSGAADTHLPSLLQLRKTTATTLAALRSSRIASPAIAKVLQKLEHAADRLHSKELSAIAIRIGQDPADAAMGKVRDMIKDMVAKLRKDAAAEATQVAWCAEEVKTNTATRKEKTAEVEAAQADIDELKASISKLGDEIAQLTQDLSDLSTAMTKSTEIRQKEHAVNTATIKDAVAAQAAVAQAMGVLQDFYAKAGQASGYTGMQDEGGGVMGMIEVIQTDFARLESEHKSAEQTGAAEYEKFMDDSKLDKVQKEKDVEHKTARKESEGQKVLSQQGDLAGIQKELDAAEEYYKTLEPKCVDKGPSYEERKAKREQEIKELQDAVEALDMIR
eukprot:TRINITY_DN690_c0_g2_i1.p1 TRINITY_DN690_c0_g2~~TRINITY_DN690_c0_g2_i1.p1  ORF type:complete len:652 (-),score=240.40 TRINITY_DN690_c0_g2_i1:263-2218(-)